MNLMSLLIFGKIMQSFLSCHVMQALPVRMFVVFTFSNTTQDGVESASFLSHLVLFADLSIYLWVCALVIIFGISYKNKSAGDLLSQIIN